MNLLERRVLMEISAPVFDYMQFVVAVSAYLCLRSQ